MANNTISSGWRDQPSGRGTFDILKTCVGTIVLLCWSSVCPNVPTQKSGYLHGISGKVQLFLLAILGPDFIFTNALGQLSAASSAKRLLHNKGHTDWNLRHCFFINMGGVHLEFPDRKLAGLSTIPVDTEQLLYLVNQGFLDLPTITEGDINDRNKTDGLVRAIAVVQTLWFAADIFGRVAQGLFITTLELTTLAFVFLMTFCSICWWRKPMDISRPLIIPIEFDLAVILSGSNPPAQPLGRTPLSFINRREWFLSQFWRYYAQALRIVLFLPAATPPLEADHFPSIDFLETSLGWELGLTWTIIAYSAIFMAAWKFHFPTDIEQVLWRISAVSCLVYGVAGVVLAGAWQHRSQVVDYTHAFLRLFGAKRKSFDPEAEGEMATLPSTATENNRLANQTTRRFDWMRNLSPYNDPMLAVPARLWLATTGLCIIYSFSRLYILVEDVIALRRLPESAFQTVDWGRYSPIL